MRGSHAFFALTPSPSPTRWERGVGAHGGAHGGAPCCAFPLSRPAGEGDKGGEGNTARLPVHACAGENSPCFKDFVPNRCTLISLLKGVGFSRAVGMARGTPASPASRVLGARVSRPHRGRNALLGNAASKHARKKPTPLRQAGGSRCPSPVYGADKGTSVGYKKSAAWSKSHPL